MNAKRFLPLAAPLALAACALLGRADVAPQGDAAVAATAIESFIAHEMADKELPALSIALVDGDKTVWAQGFGFADPEKKVPATADTVYRVGSVSKLFTDIAVMQLVERGELDLDAPVTRYLPDFKPNNPFSRQITLRQLMSHRSGLAREAPVGSYFDPTGPTLAQTVASINHTALVYAPGSHTKYSNAAVATVGYVLERTQRQPFAQYLKRAVLEPLDMRHSGFEPTGELRAQLAKAVMSTVEDRSFPAPTFELGIAPAGSMYTTVEDLGIFIGALLAGGHGANGPVLQPATLAQMWAPQPARPGDEGSFGIGFVVGDLDGHRSVGHEGAIYGFATSVLALPDEQLGVAVVATRDAANAVTNRIAGYALRVLLAQRAHQPIPRPEQTEPIPSATAKALAGRYEHGADRVELLESAGQLYRCCTNGEQVRLRQLGDELIVDDRLDYGDRLKPQDGGLLIDGKLYRRVAVPKPKPAPRKWSGLVGEYGWDHDILYVLEKDGRLWVLIEWIEFDPLTQISDDVYQFPDRGLYPGEKLTFTRDAHGNGTQVVAGTVTFKRRKVGPEEGGEQLLIEPLRPVDELLAEALRAQPPKETGKVQADLVELVKLDPTFHLDLRYAGTNNFLGHAFYSQARAFMQRDAALALTRAHRKLKAAGYGILLHDTYRPWYVTKVFWDATPDDKKMFVADPSQGSRHNRGCAGDISLYELKTGKPAQMVATFDETTDRANADYPGGTSLQRWHRHLLRQTVEAEGFTVFPLEWWHFDFNGWEKYPINNVRFEDLGAPP